MSSRHRGPTAVAILGKTSLLLLGLLAAYALGVSAFELGGVNAPAVQRADLVRLDQGWKEGESERFHARSQGTRIIPLSWFLALEQPLLTPAKVGRFADRDYLGRFGFFYEPGSTSARDADLPVGFAVAERFLAPYAKPPVRQETKVVGLTCAACHTGRIDVRLDDGSVRGVLIDGGSAMINLSLFQTALGRALYFTDFFDTRFERFAREVQEREKSAGGGTAAWGDFKKELREDLKSYISQGLANEQYAREHKLDATAGGFARTDALGLIGNRVFGVLDLENQAVVNAPVNFPHLWDTPWFDWVQYNASIRTPMARNIGEALGVGALVNLDGSSGDLYESTVDIDGLAWIEEKLGGEKRFGGLQPPKWKDMVRAVFGKEAPLGSDFEIIEGRRKEGEKLYEQHCIRCHLPPRDVLASAPEHSAYFTEPDPGSGERFLKVRVVDLSVIGTDPNQALNFYRRVAVVPEWRAPEGAADSTEARSRGAAGVRSRDGAASRAGGTGPEKHVGATRPGTRAESYRVPVPRPPAGASGAGKDYVYWSEWANDGRTDTISAAEGLFRITSFIRRKKYRDGVSEDGKLRKLLAGPEVDDPRAFNDDPAQKGRRMTMDRYRFVPRALDEGDEAAILEGDDTDWVIKANLGYKARPLDGIWATPPYLHNGSVPSLYQMLLPASARDAKFYLGSTRFDPKHVGYETYQFAGSFELDTALPGNSNQGHEFRNLTLKEFERLNGWTRDGAADREARWARVLDLKDPDKLKAMPTRERWELTRVKTGEVLRRPHTRGIKGVLGPELSDDERWALLEYLKSL